MDSSGWTNSAKGWIKFVDEGDENRTHLLDPVMIDVCGDVTNLKVLDVGAGEGRFARMLRRLDADVFCLEPVGELVSEARAREPMDRYLKGRAERLPFPDQSFDLVTQYVCLVDIEDFRAAIREMTRVTKVGGRIVLSNMTSVATAITGTCTDPQGNKLYAMHRYAEERAGWMTLRDMKVMQYHRPLSSVLTAFLESGMTLLQFLEPFPKLEVIRERPGLAGARSIPFFYVTEWRRDR